MQCNRTVNQGGGAACLVSPETMNGVLKKSKSLLTTVRESWSTLMEMDGVVRVTISDAAMLVLCNFMMEDAEKDLPLLPFMECRVKASNKRGHPSMTRIMLNRVPIKHRLRELVCDLVTRAMHVDSSGVIGTGHISLRSTSFFAILNDSDLMINSDACPDTCVYVNIMLSSEGKRFCVPSTMTKN